MTWLLAWTLSWSAIADPFCPKWTTPKEIGRLSWSMVNEASGLAASRRYKDRVYWINDSGNSPAFFLSKPDGSEMRKVNVQGVKLQDTEALSVTRCGHHDCLVIGDIGDNRKKRKALHLVFIRELEKFGDSVTAEKVITLRYPDGARDAEAMVFLPNGDFYLFSKEFQWQRLKTGPSRVYRVSAQEIETARSAPITLHYVGELPMSSWFPNKGSLAQAITDATVHPTRPVITLLTYHLAFDLPIERLKNLKNAKNFRLKVDFVQLPIHPLLQQESVTYVGDNLIWSTEYLPPKAPIFSMTCETVAH